MVLFFRDFAIARNHAGQMQASHGKLQGSTSA